MKYKRHSYIDFTFTTVCHAYENHKSSRENASAIEAAAVSFLLKINYKNTLPHKDAASK